MKGHIHSVLKKLIFVVTLGLLTFILFVSISGNARCSDNFSEYTLPDLKLSFCAPTSYESVFLVPSDISPEVKQGEEWYATFTGEEAKDIQIRIASQDFKKLGDSDVQQLPWNLFTKEAQEQQLEKELEELFGDTTVDIAYAAFDGKEFFTMLRSGAFASIPYEYQYIIMPAALNDISYNISILSSNVADRAHMMRMVRTLKKQK